MALTTSSLVPLLLILTCLNVAVNAAPPRERRSLWQLNTLIGCYTGHSGLMMMNGYGCWCGLGGGGQPVDETDRCCQGHDNCYQILEDNNCGVYFSSYAYTSYNCDIPGRGSVTCTSDIGCERALCECDRRLAQCLRANEATYHEAFANYEKRFCDEGIAGPGLTRQIITSNSSITMVDGREADAYHVNQVPLEHVVDVGGRQTGNHLGAGPN